MNIAPRDVEKAALDLEPELRAKLATLLIRSLEETEDVDEKEIEGLWLAEAEERARQIDAGEAEMLAAEDVLQELRSQEAAGATREV